MFGNDAAPQILVGWRLPLLVEFLAFEADPFAFMVFVSAESGWHHRYAAGRTDWRTVIRITEIAHSLDAPATRRECDRVGTMSVSSLRLWAKRDTTMLDIPSTPSVAAKRGSFRAPETL